MSTALVALEQRLQETLGRSVIGLKPVIRALTIAVVARGHVLLQGPPGLGKTLLSKSLAAALGGTFNRVQGTADLMPSDIIGVHVYDAAKREFEFRPGPLLPIFYWWTKSIARAPRRSPPCSRRWRSGKSRWSEEPMLCPRSSWSWPRRTPASSREPIRCPNRSWTDSCCASI